MMPKKALQVQVIIWDVQHGSAAYIRTPSGKHIVQDLGTGSYGQGDKEFSPLKYLRNKGGVTQLDAVIITHPHRDHLDDIFNFDLLSPRVLLRPKHLTDDDIRADNPSADERTVKIIQKYLGITKRYSQPVLDEENPFLPQNNGGAEINCFVSTGCSTSNLNNHSIVTVISYAGFKIIIPGDNEQCSWNELLEDPRFRKAISEAHILVAAHHGRENGFFRELFDFFQPYLTVVSDGPFCDTSASSRYSAVSKGLRVKRRNGESAVRKCVTTRNDGVVVITFGYNQLGLPSLEVVID